MEARNGKSNKQDEARRNGHGLDPEVGNGAGDALPTAGVRVTGPPAGETLHGGVEGQLELQQRLAWKQPSKQTRNSGSALSTRQARRQQ
jgi:hypothetical protein